MKLNFKIADTIGIQFDLEEDKWFRIEVGLDKELQAVTNITELTVDAAKEFIKDREVLDEYQGTIREVRTLLTDIQSSKRLLNNCVDIIKDIIKELKIEYLPINNDRDIYEYAIKDLNRYYVDLTYNTVETIGKWLRSKVESLVKENYYSHNYTVEIIRLQSEFGPISQIHNSRVVDKFYELTGKHNVKNIDSILELLGIIPGYGKSKYIIGEIFRACNRIMYRFVNDGDPGYRYQDGNFVDTCNLYDYLETDFRSEFKEDIDRFFYNLSQDSVSHADKITPFEELQEYQLSKLYTEQSIYFEDPALNAIFIELAFYHVMVEKAIEASDDIMTALRNLDVDYLKSNIKLGENCKFKSDLFANNSLDFRSELLYFNLYY